MSHINLRYTVQGSIVSTDTDLLDAIESALPAEGTVVLGDEYSINRVSDSPDLGDGEKQISARMTFAPDGDEFAVENGTTKKVVESDAGDGEILRENATDIFGPQGAADTVFTQVKNHDLASKAEGWELQLYRSPQGGVLASDVQAWYEEDPTRQPEREVEQPDGSTTTEQYVPSAFDPQNHIIKEVTG